MYESEYIGSTLLLGLNTVAHMGLTTTALDIVIQSTANLWSSPLDSASAADLSGRVLVDGLMFVICLGLVYDNLILAAGRFIGPNPIFRELSRVRYAVDFSPTVFFPNAFKDRAGMSHDIHPFY